MKIRVTMTAHVEAKDIPEAAELHGKFQKAADAFKGAHGIPLAIEMREYRGPRKKRPPADA